MHASPAFPTTWRMRWTMFPPTEIVKAVMEGESKDLIESVAEDIAGQILETLNVSAVRVTIKKPEVAIRGSILSYAGLEIYRRRE